MAQSTETLIMDAEAQLVPAKAYATEKRTPKKLTKEDRQTIIAMEGVMRELERLHNRFDHIREPLLVDSTIYELKAAQLKYEYYLQICKEKGLISAVFSPLGKRRRIKL